MCEFLLNGLKRQSVNISSCSLDTAHSTRNLGFIFDEHNLHFWRDISSV